MLGRRALTSQFRPCGRERLARAAAPQAIPHERDARAYTSNILSRATLVSLRLRAEVNLIGIR